MNRKNLLNLNQFSIVSPNNLKQNTPKMDTNSPQLLFYLNMKLLQLFVPMNQKLNGLLKPKMFEVPNKSDFNEVIYYLLSIVDPKFCSVVKWPCLDIKDERKFRVEISKSISGIVTSSHCDFLPQLNSSLIMAPGGFLVIDFISKFSLFVLIQVVQNLIGISWIKPVNIHPAIRKARQRLNRSIYVKNIKETALKLYSQRNYVEQHLRKFRELQKQQPIIEKEKNEVLSELKILIDQCEVGQSIKCRLSSGKIDEALEQWKCEKREELNEIETYVSVLCDFERNIDYTHEALDRMVNPGKRIVLNGQALKISCSHPSIDSRLVLFKNNNLILENLFKIGCEVIRILNHELEAVDTRNIFLNLDLSFLDTSYSAICSYYSDFCHIYEGICGLKEEFSKHKKLKINEANMEFATPLSNQLISIQSPKLVVNGSQNLSPRSKVLQNKAESILKWVVKQQAHKAAEIQKNQSRTKVKSLLQIQSKIEFNLSSNKVKKSLSLSGMKSDKKENLGKSLIPKAVDKTCKRNILSFVEYNLSPIKQMNITPSKGMKSTNKMEKNDCQNHNDAGKSKIRYVQASSLKTPKKFHSLTLHESGDFEASGSVEIDSLLDFESIQFPHDLSRLTLSPASSVGLPSPIKAISSATNSSLENTQNDSGTQSPSGVLKYKTDKEVNSGPGKSKNISILKARPSLESLVHRYKAVRRQYQEFPN